MNFAQIREVAGQKDEKGFQVKLTMFGTLNSVESIAFSGKGTRFQKTVIADDNGEQQKVKIYVGKGDGLSMNLVNQRLSFDIGPNPFENQMYYNGFWNNRVQVSQAPAQQPASQNAPQGPQEPAGGAKEDEPVDWDAKDLRQARMNGLNNATRLMVMLAEMNKTNMAPNDIKKVAAEYVDYIYNGIQGGSLPNNYDAANQEMDENENKPEY